MLRPIALKQRFGPLFWTAANPLPAEKREKQETFPDGESGGKEVIGLKAGYRSRKDEKRMKMIEIDGSFGEGGGQILRTSLSLAALTGKGVRFTRIRAGRRKPGLMRQHLACVRAIAEISGGNVEGCELNSTEVIFEPRKIRAGNYRFVVGSAGSVLLIAQCVLPCLLHAEGESVVVLEGGTHAESAPIYDFFERVYLPCLRRMGAEVSSELNQVGFYPAGGGKVTLRIQPMKHRRYLEIMEAGGLREARLTALSHGIDPKIGEDEVRICHAALENDPAFILESRMVNSPGPGNVLFAELASDHITELFSICGDVDISRKEVAERVAGMVRRYRELEVPVWRFLADQLLLPMAIGAGGKYLTVPPSRHSQTNLEVIRKFLDIEIKLENRKNGQYCIEVKK